METTERSLIEKFSGKVKFNKREKYFEFPEIDTMGRLNVLAGVNGSGKTLYMTMVWYTAYVLTNYRIHFLMNPTEIDKTMQYEIPLITKATFGKDSVYKCKVDISGFQGCDYKFGFKYKNEELKDFYLEIEDPEAFISGGGVAIPQFNSKNARLISDYERYLDLLDMLGLPMIQNHEQALKLVKQFKLFDIVWFESLRAKIHRLQTEPLTLDNHRGYDKFKMEFALENGAADVRLDPDNFEAFIAKGDIPYVVTKNGEEAPLSDLSAGTQALLMLTVFGAHL